MKLEGLVRATVLFPMRKGRQGEEVLLARKTKKIGVGLYNGIGGGVEENETIDAAAIRETVEEVGIRVRLADLERSALIYCNNYNKQGDRFVCKLYALVARRFEGVPAIQKGAGLTDLRWHPLRKLPIGEMMFGDREWIERILNGERILGEIFYSKDMEGFEKPPRIERATQEELNRAWTP